MLKKLSFLLVGFFCSGLLVAHAAQPNEDRFNFFIANPNTVEPKKFMFELKPGETGSDYAIVKNVSDVPLKFSLYGSDGTRTAQGSFALETKSEESQEVGKWITFDDKELTLNPGEYRKVKFHVQVPADAAEGTYSGGVSAEKTRPDAQNPNVTIAVRISLRVDVKVTVAPHPVAKKYADLGENPFYQVYFWASLGLFVVSAGALGWSFYSDRKTAHHKRKPAKK